MWVTLLWVTLLRVPLLRIAGRWLLARWPVPRLCVSRLCVLLRGTTWLLVSRRRVPVACVRPARSGRLGCVLRRRLRRLRRVLLGVRIPWSSHDLSTPARLPV